MQWHQPIHTKRHLHGRESFIFVIFLFIHVNDTTSAALHLEYIILLRGNFLLCTFDPYNISNALFDKMRQNTKQFGILIHSELQIVPKIQKQYNSQFNGRKRITGASMYLLMKKLLSLYCIVLQLEASHVCIQTQYNPSEFM